MLRNNEHLDESNPLLSAALEYARLGYPVFPCAPGTKVPFAGTRGKDDATTDEATIRAWWAKTPTANLAIECSGLLVVDIDGATNPWPHEEHRKADLSDAPAAMTPKGGRHYVFRSPAGMTFKDSQGKLAEKVDTRSNGGYIVAWPSTIKDGSYSWIEGCELDIPRERLPEPPAWLIDAAPKAGTTGGSSGKTKAASADGNQIPDGQRNGTLMNLAGVMRRKGMSQREIEAALMVVNADRCNPPLDEREVCIVARNAAKFAPDQIDTAWAEGHFQQDRANDAAAKVWKLETRRFDTITEGATQWLWEGRIPLGMLTILEGPPKEGKSTLVYDLIGRVTTGRVMPDGQPASPELRKCLIIAPEDPAEQVIKPRLMAARADLAMVHQLEGFATEDGKRRRFTLSDADRRELEALIKNEGIGLVFVDAIMGLLPIKVDSNSDQQVRTSILDPLADLAKQTGISIILGRHWSKGAGLRQSYERGLGSIAWTGVARSLLQVASHPDDKKLKLLAVGATNLLGEQSTLGFRIAPTIVVGADGAEIPTSTIAWEGVVDIDPEDMGRAGSSAPSGRQECSEWLLARLGELGGDAASDQLEREAIARGYSLDILKRAKLALKQQQKAKSVKSSNEWRVRLWDFEAIAIADKIFN